MGPKRKPPMSNDSIDPTDSTFEDDWDKLEIKLNDINFDAAGSETQLGSSGKKINELINSNQAKTIKLDEELTKLKNNLTLKDKAIAGLEDDNYRLSQEVDDLEQYTRRNNVRIYGVAEQPEENSDNLAFDFFKSELNVDIASNNISRSHRVSKKSGVEPRPIIMRFTKHNSKVAVMSRRRPKPQNRKSQCPPHLTINRREILKYLNKDIEEGIVSKVWTVDGVISFRPSGDSSVIERCTSLEDCQEIIAKYCE
ncbi:unnamed protein product [Porites lobata]|uniref:Uncharacterized protein n=1 Tax=Porites lobata TaxID=104759 RepID=A0ABN8PAJ5_9CNID|nr:unnamed protein product [Porites lobata]